MSAVYLYMGSLCSKHISLDLNLFSESKKNDLSFYPYCSFLTRMGWEITQCSVLSLDNSEGPVARWQTAWTVALRRKGLPCQASFSNHYIYLNPSWRTEVLQTVLTQCFSSFAPADVLNFSFTSQPTWPMTQVSRRWCPNTSDYSKADNPCSKLQLVLSTLTVKNNVSGR